MLTNLCFGVTCLLIPVLIELFNLQAGLPISNTDHTLVEILILCGMYGLFLQILRLDERLYLQNLIQRKYISAPERRKATIEKHVQSSASAELTHPSQPKAAAFHRPRLPFENVDKDHRTVKP
jgi:hypothetical protein